MSEQTMSREKQIEEMAKMMVDSDNKEVADALSLFFVRLAEALYNAGYRKQSEGEWEEPPFVMEIIPLSDENYWDKLNEKKEEANNPYRCSVCKRRTKVKTNFCPNCGAKLKGGAE